MSIALTVVVAHGSLQPTTDVHHRLRRRNDVLSTINHQLKRHLLICIVTVSETRPEHDVSQPSAVQRGYIDMKQPHTHASTKRTRVHVIVCDTSLRAELSSRFVTLAVRTALHSPCQRLNAITVLELSTGKPAVVWVYNDAFCAFTADNRRRRHYVFRSYVRLSVG